MTQMLAPAHEVIAITVDDQKCQINAQVEIEAKCCKCECHRKQNEIKYSRIKPTLRYKNAESECMNGKFADITFVVGKDKNQTEFPAMRGIFAMHCSYFANKLFSEESFVFGQKIVEEDINVTPIAFRYICQYFYQLNPVINADNVIDILYAANKYGLEEIQTNCDAFIDSVYKNQHIPNILSFETRAIHFSFEITHSLRQRFHKFLTVETSQRILKSEAFLSAPKELIIQIIQNDCFSVTEEDIWIRCKDWCNHQIKINYECKEVTDSISWIALMKDTFVKHIRFSLMSKEFFVNQVYVSKVLSVEESIKITLYFMDPTTKISYNIAPRHKVIYKYASELFAAQSKLKLYKTAQVLQYKLNISNKANCTHVECQCGGTDNTYEALTNNNVNNGVATNVGAYAFIEANFDGKKQIIRMDIAGFGSAAGKGWNVGHLNNRMIQYKDHSGNWVDWKCIDGLEESKISVMDMDIETSAMRVYYKAEGHICMGCWRFYGHDIVSDRDV
eukprot:321775_1